MWLLRGLSFTCKALQNAQANKTAELAAAFNQSYEGTLKKFHNFVVKGIFAVCIAVLRVNLTYMFAWWHQVAMKACPYRADFYAKLAADPNGGASASQDQLSAELDQWLAALEAIVTRMETFYEKGGHGKGF